MDACKGKGGRRRPDAGPTSIQTWNQGIHVLRGFPRGVDYLISFRMSGWGAGHSSKSAQIRGHCWVATGKRMLPIYILDPSKLEAGPSIFGGFSNFCAGMPGNERLNTS